MAGRDPTTGPSSAFPAELAPYPAVMALVPMGKATGQVTFEEVRSAFEADQVPPVLRHRTLAVLSRILGAAGVLLAAGGDVPPGAQGSGGGAGSGTGRLVALARLDGVRAVLAASGAELSQEELLDALWLATRLPAGAADAPLERARTVRDDDGVQRATVSHGGDSRWGDPESPVAEGPPGTSQAPPGPPGPHPLGAVPGSAAWTLGAGTLGQGAQAGAGSTASRGAYGAAGTRPGRAAGSGLYGAPGAPLLSTAVPRVRPPSRRAVPLRVPEGKALRAELSLGRALRPLKQHRPNPLRREMDEVATAAALAETGLPDVVTRPTRERWLDLALVVDDGLSMLLWRRLAVELRTLMQRSGAFRVMRVHGLRSRGGGTPALRAKPYAPGAATLPTAAVSDPSGQTLVLVVSDGVGAAWRDGRMTAVLERWAAHGPTAVVHALPPRLWQSSGIRAERWRVTTRRPGAANADWTVTDPVLPPALAGFDGVPVPVLEPAAGPMADWARLMSSPSGTALLPLMARPRPTRGASAGSSGNPGSRAGAGSSQNPAGGGSAAGGAGTGSPTTSDSTAGAGSPTPPGSTAGVGSPTSAGSTAGTANPTTPGSTAGTANPTTPGSTAGTADPTTPGSTAGAAGPASANGAVNGPRPAAPRTAPSGGDDLRRLQRFRDAASPEAYRLAAHLAAVAPLSVPVMRLVQSSVEWQADTGHLAEVFLGGLMRPAPSPPAAGPEPLPVQHRTFTFTPAAQEALLDAVPVGELLRTGEVVGRKLARLAGRSPDFPAWLAHPDGPDHLPSAGRPFATVEQRLAARFGASGRRSPAPRLRAAMADGWAPLLPTDPRTLGPYTLLTRNGTGARTLAFMAYKPTGETAVVRTVAWSDDDAHHLLRTESEALRRMAGRHAPRLLATGLDQDPPWLAEEARNDTVRLSAAVSRARWDAGTAFAIARQLADAVRVCAEEGLVHGDLHAETVHVAGLDVVLTGWSSAIIDGVSASGAETGHVTNIRDLGMLLRRIGGGEYGGTVSLDAVSLPRWPGAQWEPLRRLVAACLRRDTDEGPTIHEVWDVFERYERIGTTADGAPVYSPPRPADPPPPPAPQSPPPTAAVWDPERQRWLTPPRSTDPSSNAPWSEDGPAAYSGPPQISQEPPRAEAPPPPPSPAARAFVARYGVPLSGADPARLGPYRLLGRLAPGPNSSFYLAQYGMEDSDAYAAVRTRTVAFRPWSRDISDLRTEAEALRRMAGRYAPKLLGQDLNDRPPWVAREFFAPSEATPVRTLRELLVGGVGLDAPTAADLGRQLAEAVRLCELNGVVHGNLSPDTVLIVDGAVKLIGWTSAVFDGRAPRRDATAASEDDRGALGDILLLLAGASLVEQPGPGAGGTPAQRDEEHWAALREIALAAGRSRHPADPSTTQQVAALLAGYVTERKPVEPPDTADRRVARVRAPLASGHHIAVMSFRPEVGKATTAVALGAAFARLRQEPVVVFDAAAPGSRLAQRVAAARDSGGEFNQFSARNELWRLSGRGGRGRLDVLIQNHRSAAATAGAVLDGTGYGRTLARLRQEYPIVISEAGCNTARTASLGVFDHADQLIVVCPPNDDGGSHRALVRLIVSRYADLAQRAIVVVPAMHGPLEPADLRSASARYEGLCRAVVPVPYDRRLWSNPKLNLDRLTPATRDAFVHLAALVAEGFAVQQPDGVQQLDQTDE
ncbi:SAV_2336 N-terminal domain-related protein [Streptomyces sp. P1-3]|uniref:SAV_2336 N-terminal domain-related protein n=1 Tax=Streptomyces sp. P1-3 TaxID=3421658 RepID=UPI003D35F979